MKNNGCHSNKREPLPFVIYIPIHGHVLVHYVDKTHVMVVTVELICLLVLNIFSFNFVSTPNKSPSFARFRRSYVSHPAIGLTNHSYTVFFFFFCFLFAFLNGPFSFFCSCLSIMTSAFA